jgi:hypothetical protein
VHCHTYVLAVIMRAPCTPFTAVSAQVIPGDQHPMKHLAFTGIAQPDAQRQAGSGHPAAATSGRRHRLSRPRHRPWRAPRLLARWVAHCQGYACLCSLRHNALVSGDKLAWCTPGSGHHHHAVICELSPRLAVQLALKHCQPRYLDLLSRCWAAVHDGHAPCVVSNCMLRMLAVQISRLSAAAWHST